MSAGYAKVADVLKSKGSTVQTIKPTETVGKLANQMRAARIGVVLVSNDGKTLDGIVSERDVAYGVAAHQAELHTLPVSALMTKNVITCSPDDTLMDVSKVMAERRIRHLPVADGSEIAGVISIRDVVLHRVGEVHRLADLVKSH
jgi:CBS domain-containing protein